VHEKILHNLEFFYSACVVHEAINKLDCNLLFKVSNECVLLLMGWDVENPIICIKCVLYVLIINEVELLMWSFSNID